MSKIILPVSTAALSSNSALNNTQQTEVKADAKNNTQTDIKTDNKISNSKTDKNKNTKIITGTVSGIVLLSILGATGRYKYLQNKQIKALKTTFKEQIVNLMSLNMQAKQENADIINKFFADAQEILDNLRTQYQALNKIKDKTNYLQPDETMLKTFNTVKEESQSNSNYTYELQQMILKTALDLEGVTQKYAKPTLEECIPKAGDTSLISTSKLRKLMHKFSESAENIQNCDIDGFKEQYNMFKTKRQRIFAEADDLVKQIDELISDLQKIFDEKLKPQKK